MDKKLLSKMTENEIKKDLKKRSLNRILSQDIIKSKKDEFCDDCNRKIVFRAGIPVCPVHTAYGSAVFQEAFVINQEHVFNRFKEICRYSGIRIVGTFVLPCTITVKSIPEEYLVRAKRLGKSL